MRKIILTLLCVFSFSPVANAHAHLEKSVPAANAKISAPPKEVSVTFSEGIEPAFSEIAVTNVAGNKGDIALTKKFG